MTALLVTVAGALGVAVRYVLTAAVPSIWMVVVINVAGSFLLGLLVTAGEGLSSDVRLASSVGFLGGFTTFSTFTVQVVIEADGGRSGVAAAYLLTSVAAGMAAAVAGYAVGRTLA